MYVIRTRLYHVYKHFNSTSTDTIKFSSALVADIVHTHLVQRLFFLSSRCSLSRDSHHISWCILYVYIYIYALSLSIGIYIYIYIYTYRIQVFFHPCQQFWLQVLLPFLAWRDLREACRVRLYHAVSSHTFNSQNFKLRVSNRISQYIWLCVKHSKSSMFLRTCMHAMIQSPSVWKTIQNFHLHKLAVIQANKKKAVIATLNFRCSCQLSRKGAGRPQTNDLTPLPQCLLLSLRSIPLFHLLFTSIFLPPGAWPERDWQVKLPSSMAAQVEPRMCNPVWDQSGIFVFLLGHPRKFDRRSFTPSHFSGELSRFIKGGCSGNRV